MSITPQREASVLLIPYAIETLLHERPWANWLIMAACSLVSLGMLLEAVPEAWALNLMLDGWSPLGLFGHVLVHGGLVHLAGNMIFLWTFGNALCGNIRNIVYLFVFPFCALIAAIVHNIVDGSPAVGASGAINGVVGFILALYPINRVHLFWWLIVRMGTTSCPAWIIISLWFAFDIWGAARGTGEIAYWAHIGGFVGGLCCGLVFLHFGWVRLTQWDNRSLLQILKREPADSRWS